MASPEVPRSSQPAAVSPSKGVLANRIVQALWRCGSFPVSGSASSANTPVEVLGWGRKVSGFKAIKQAQAKGLPFWLLEDGFVRSLGREDDSLSLVQDDLGIHYDATAPSRLESLIPQPLSDQQQQRADAIAEQWRRLNISKYNAAPDYIGELPDDFVLVVDQVAGDASIAYGLADAERFRQMLTAALDENPLSAVVLKVHPDAYTRAKAGHFDLATLKHPRLKVIAENCHPGRLLSNARMVYTVTSQMGFEALMWGKPVRCFGMPFYAGWGLTHDVLDAPMRRRQAAVVKIRLQQLVHAVLVSYSRYMDPETEQETDIETVMTLIHLQRQQWLKNHALGTVHALGFSRWKKPILQDFLYGADVHFCNKAEEVPAGATLVRWGVKPVPKALEGKLKRVIRVEDGFLRSSGLGADLIRPLSWVFDDQGMYYDATQPSHLEHILANHEFDDVTLDSARNLRKTIVSARISKYNLTAGDWVPSGAAKGQKVVLVPGQVESDASIRTGAGKIKTNLDLLKAARAAEPDAWLVFKPHPDVMAGLRSKDVAMAEYEAICDEIVLAGDSSQMLEQVHAVHTMTSLLGFEALLREREVYCYGMPFYAGWGITYDEFKNPRRSRQRSLDELVAAALMEYPSYVSAKSRRFSSAERIVAELQRWKANGPSKMPLWRQALRVVLRLWVTTGIRKGA